MNKNILLVLIGILGSFSAKAVCVYDSSNDTWVDEDTRAPCPNAIPTAAPFLLITPDARSGAMGDAGVAISPDANAMHKNVARLAFAENKMEISATYTPWLSSLGLDDIYLAYLSGYYKLDENQALGASIRYFSLGNVDFVDVNQQSQGSNRPNEFEVALGYSRKLSDKLSLGASAKFIYSDLAAGQRVDGFDIKAGLAGAVSLGLYYTSVLDNLNQDELSFGMAMNNLGSKISYTTDTRFSDFLPQNLSIGAAYGKNIDDFNKIVFTLEANKLMVPTPTFPNLDPGTPNPDHDADGNGIPDYREKGFFEGTFGSFTDAPNGFSEELQEFTISAGVEYNYNDQFALRGGYFTENNNKGGRKYATLGFGIRYQLLTINMSYLISTQSIGQATNPLDRTLRFSIILNMDNDSN